MHRARLLSIAAVAIVAACDTAPATLAPPSSADLAVASQSPVYLVTFRDDVTDVAGTARELARVHGFGLRHVRTAAARGFSAIIPPGRVESIRTDPRVLLVERDGPVSLIHPIHVAAGRPGTGQAIPWGITRVGGAGDGTGKTAWVIDTGIDLDHPDLNTSRACHVSFVTRGPLSPEDINGHGTHVSGTIAARDNAIDVVGVAANAFVCSVRVLDASGSGTWEWVINGVNHVAANGARGEVANMSLGGTGSNATLEKAVLDASATVKFSLAAGNNGSDANNFTPARVNGRNIYTVSAIASSDCLTSWSNWGNPPVDFAAPGSGVLSTRKGGGTTTFSGTSMAAPHVAGILLLGSVTADGTACNDPDGTPDPIAHR